MGLDESGTLAALRAHRRELIDPKIAEYDGRIVKGTGDGLLLEFPSVVDAVRCAVEVQRGMAERNTGIAPDQRLDFRIGINVGDIIIDGDDIFGDGVNVAARLEALADPGGICVSRVVRDHVADKLSFTFEDLGAQQVKNIARPVDIFRVNLGSGRPRAYGPSRKLWQRLSRGPMWQQLATGLFVIGVGGITGWALLNREPVSPKQMIGAPINSLAVLPLANLSGDISQEYFADGMTEALITELAKIGALKVISRTSVMQYKGTRKSLPEIARALGVAGIIEGSVLRDGDQVKITVQLISAPSDTHLWAQDYVRDLRNILVLQSEVARAIAKQVKVTLTPVETASFASSKPVNPEAYDLYLRGRALADRAENRLRAIELYEQATAKDPDYASAYGALSYTLITTFNGGKLERTDAFPRALQAAQRAIELNPENLDAMKAQAAVASIIHRDFPTAEKVIRHILERAPNDAETHYWLARLLALQGHFDDAVAEGKRALELDPQSVERNADLAFIYLKVRKYDECIDQVHATLKIDPNSWRAYGVLGACYDAKGSYVEGAKALERHLVLWGEDPSMAAQMVTAQARGGYRARMLASLSDDLKQSERSNLYWGGVASTYGVLGNKDKAFEYLDRAYQEYDPWILNLQDSAFDSLRDDPRWLAFLRRLNLLESPMAKLPAAPAAAAR